MAAAETTTVQEFDLRRRALSDLVGQWKADCDSVRQVWDIEDLIAQQTSAAMLACELVEHFRSHGEFPDAEILYSHFIDMAERWLTSAKELQELADSANARGAAVKGLDRLNNSIEQISEIINEDRFASDASSAGGALDDWE